MTKTDLKSENELFLTEADWKDNSGLFPQVCPSLLSATITYKLLCCDFISWVKTTSPWPIIHSSTLPSCIHKFDQGLMAKNILCPAVVKCVLTFNGFVYDLH